MKRNAIFRCWSFGLLVLSMFWAVIAVAQDMLQLGQLSYSRAEAEYLRAPVTRSFTFFRAVGGVAFSAVASGKDGLKASSIAYDAAAPDGQRLVVTVRTPSGEVQQVRGNIHDWQLVPIARFARDENGSAMTLFGRLKDKAEQQQILQNDQRVINYHPALDNTLVGLRLMQADILILRPEAADLFKQGGTLILGAGESGHNVQRNTERFHRVGQWLTGQVQAGNRFQSYVVGDLDQNVEFYVRDGRLQFDGVPYWTAWKGKHDPAHVAARMNDLRPRYEALIAQYNDTLRDARARANSMSDMQVEQVKQRLDALKFQIDAADRDIDELQAVEMMPAFSRDLSALIRQQNGVNPLVYATVTKVMHYRALFKHVQKQNPAAYAAFVQTLSSVQVAPAVRTPTVQHGR